MRLLQFLDLLIQLPQDGPLRLHERRSEMKQPALDSCRGQRTVHEPNDHDDPTKSTRVF